MFINQASSLNSFLDSNSFQRSKKRSCDSNVADRCYCCCYCYCLLASLGQLADICSRWSANANREDISAGMRMAAVNQSVVDHLNVVISLEAAALKVALRSVDAEIEYFVCSSPD